MKKLIILVIVFLAVFPVVAQQKNKRLNTTPIRIINADFNTEKGTTKTVWRKCIGAGRANEGLRADWQDQLRLVKKECGFEYIRMHGLLHDDMGVYFEDKKGNPVYNWQYIDKLYDFLLEIGIKPFVELSFMPKALASGTNTCFWWKGNVTPPKSYEKWYDFIKALTQHFTERYGQEEVKTWYFEVWNEPNLKYFFTGSMEEYFKLYDYTAKAVKSVSVDYRVGGPATAGNAWVTEMIEYCAKNNCPIDFISTHDYAVKKGLVDENGFTPRILIADPKAITNNVLRSYQKIKQSTMPNLELHYTEWSTSPTSEDPIHDSYHSAAFILDKIKCTENAANSMSYWVFTDIFEEAGIRATPFHGGFGLLNYQGIKKPAFFAYQFLNQLGETELVNSDSASWVCKSKNGNIQALLWNFTITHPGDSVANQVYYKRDLQAKPVGKVQLKLQQVPAGTYRCKMYKSGYRVNDAYATYLDEGSPAQLSRANEKRMKSINNGDPLTTQIVKIDESGKFDGEYEIRQNDVLLIVLEKL